MSHDFLASAAQGPSEQKLRVKIMCGSPMTCARPTEKITGIFVELKFRMFLALFYSLND